MKKYQMLIGLTIIAVAIIIAGLLLSNAINKAGNEIAGQIPPFINGSIPNYVDTLCSK